MTPIFQVSKYIKEVSTATKCYISIKIDLDAIDKLHLDLDIHSVASAILVGKCKDSRVPILNLLKSENICVVEGCKDKVRQRECNYMSVGGDGFWYLSVPVCVCVCLTLIFLFS